MFLKYTNPIQREVLLIHLGLNRTAKEGDISEIATWDRAPGSIRGVQHPTHSA